MDAYLCDTLYRATDCEDSFVDTWDDFADASLDTSLLPEFCDVLPGPSNDDAGILCADEGSEGENVVSLGCGRAGLGSCD